MTSSAVDRGKRIPIEDLGAGDKIRWRRKDVTVAHVTPRPGLFVIRAKESGQIYRIPKGRKIRRQHA